MAMTTSGTVIATRTAAASGDIDVEEFVVDAPGGDAAIPLVSLIFVVLVTDAVQSFYQHLVATI